MIRSCRGWRFSPDTKASFSASPFARSGSSPGPCRRNSGSWRSWWRWAPTSSRSWARRPWRSQTAVSRHGFWSATTTPAGKPQLEFRDYAYRNKLWCKGVADLALVGVENVTLDDEGFARRLSVKYATKFTGTEPQRGERFQLHPRFTDFNADRVIEHLQELDRAGGGLFVPLVRDPMSAARVRPLPAAVEAAAGARRADWG